MRYQHPREPAVLAGGKYSIVIRKASPHTTVLSCAGKADWTVGGIRSLNTSRRDGQACVDSDT